MSQSMRRVWIILMLVCASAYGFERQDPDKASPVRNVQIHNNALLVVPVGDYQNAKDGLAWNDAAFIKFTSRYGTLWDVSMDHRNGRPQLIQGQGIPWIPGAGNTLTAQDMEAMGIKAADISSIDTLAMFATDFIDENPGLFRVDMKQIELDRDGCYISPKYSSIRFNQIVNGIPVEKSHIFFRVNNGNLIQFGSYQYETVSISTDPKISSEKAYNIAADYISNKLSNSFDLEYPLELKIIAAASEGNDARPGEKFMGAEGTGYAHRLVYEMFILEKTTGAELQIIVDANTGEILIFQDYRKFGVVDGGIWPTTNLDTEVVRPFPNAYVSNNGTKETDAGGNYTFSAGTATITLNGRYVTITDNCTGSLSLSTTTSPGDLHFLSSSGNDCTTPGVGGGDNTHATRNCFYHISKMKEKARYYQPGITWINGNLGANVNINNTCNAYWGSGTVNFYRSGGGCSNTGEIASVFLHETAHGLDTNDQNGFSADAGSGEAYADTASFLQTRVSCIGHNFVPGTPCDYGCDSTCTGVRDVNTATNITTSNVASSPFDCDYYGCPYYGYMGPMGYEGHCESLLATQPFWDAITAVRAVVGDQAGWIWADRMFYMGVASIDAAYQVVSGGQCNTSATINGCGSSNYYTVFLGIDDDDGNLSNGTPNACRLYAQFNLHGVACSTYSTTCYTNPGCPSVGTPVISASSGASSAFISWSATTNATSYQIFRNDIGCSYGMNPITTITTTSYTDTAVAVGVTYYYVVQAINSYSDDCRSQMSNCASVTISAGPTNTPTISATPTISPTITQSPTITRTPTITPTPTITLTPTITQTPTITRTPTITGTPTQTPLVTYTPTYTPTPCIIAGFDPSQTYSNTNSYGGVTYYYDDGSGTGAVTTDGTLTGWAVRATTAGSIALRVIRPVGSSYTYVGGSSTVSVSVGVNNFLGTLNIPVQDGDIAALFYPTSGTAAIGLNGTGDYLLYYEGDVATAGTFSTTGNSSRNGYQLVRIYGDCAGTPLPTSTPTSACPGGTYMEPLVQAFETWPLTGWTIVNNSGDCVWRAGSEDDEDNLTGGTGDYADADSDDCGSGTDVNSELRSPSFSLLNYTSASLEFKSDMYYYGSGGAAEYWHVDVSTNGGSSWSNLLTRSGQDYRGPETITLSLSSVLNASSVMIRFHYYGAYDWWWQVDDVKVYGCQSSTSTATPTLIPTSTATAIPTSTATRTATATATRTPTSIPTHTALPTSTSTPVPTNTALPTSTSTPVPTNTAIPTATNTVVPTNTSVPTSTQTAVPTNTPVATYTNTAIPTHTSIPTNTPVNTAIPTFTSVPATSTPTSVGPTATPPPIPATRTGGLAALIIIFSVLLSFGRILIKR